MTESKQTNSKTVHSLRYRRHHRLSGKVAYGQVFDQGQRRTSGPMTIFAKANGLDHPRLGLSVSRKVGGAVLRGRIKRRLREAFRHLQHEFPIGCDYVIVCRKHEILAMQEYQRLLYGAMRHHQKKLAAKNDPTTSSVHPDQNKIK